MNSASQNRLRTAQRGQNYTEYSLMLALIGVVLIVVLGATRDVFAQGFFTVLCELRDLGRNQTSCDFDGSTIIPRTAEEDPDSPIPLFEWSPTDSSATDDPFIWTFDATASSDPNGDPLTYFWTFGDGDTATGDIVEKTFATEGNYFVTMTVTDSTGKSTTQGRLFTIEPGSNIPPTANFLWTCPTLTCNFRADQPLANPSTDPDGNDANLVYDWDFAGNPDNDNTAPQASYTFPATGRYTVTLTVTDERGASSFTIRDVEVTSATGNANPTASFTINNCGAGDFTCDFDASASNDPDGTIISYEWDWDNNGVYDASSPNPTGTSYSFTPCGSPPCTYQVRLRVTDNSAPAGASVTTQTITIDTSNIPPDASISSHTCTPSGSDFDCTFNSSANDTDGSVVGYEWDFTYDGSNFNIESTAATPPAQTYAAGNYTVGFRVTDNEGATSAIFEYALVVSGNNPPQFVGSPAITVQSGSDPCIAFSVGVTDDNDSISDMNFGWDFDYNGTFSADTMTSGSANANQTTHEYTSNGNYEVAVQVTDSGGQSSLTTVSGVSVSQSGSSCGGGTETASASFTVFDGSSEVTHVSGPITCDASTPNQCTFTDTSSSSGSGSITSCSWELRDSANNSITTSSACNLTATFPQAGEYTATLTVTDNDGDDDVASTTIYVPGIIIDAIDITHTFNSKWDVSVDITFVDERGNPANGVDVDVPNQFSDCTVGANGICTTERTGNNDQCNGSDGNVELDIVDIRYDGRTYASMAFDNADITSSEAVSVLPTWNANQLLLDITKPGCS
jgi:PKD repeat protein/Flp pilus assembly pilin Flp